MTTAVTFRFWSKAERDALDAKYFGDPANKAYPVKTQGDLDSAVSTLGRTKDKAKRKRIKAKLIQIAHALKLTLPDAWKTGMSAFQATDEGGENPVEEGGESAGTEAGEESSEQTVHPMIYPLLHAALHQALHKRHGHSHLIHRITRTHVHHQAVGGPRLVTPYRIDSGNGVRLGTSSADTSEVIRMTATFSLNDPVRDGDYLVYRNFKVFEAGEYPDKEFPITPEELAIAVEEFAAVPIDLEHRSTLLDGQLGELTGVRMHTDGWTMLGDAKIPAWLDALLPQRGVSLTWDRGTKTIAGMALTRDPRVTDANLEAAFTASPQFAGSRHSAADRHDMQTIHDIAQRQGAACPEVSSPWMHAHAEGGSSMSIFEQIAAGMFRAAAGMAAPAEAQAMFAGAAAAATPRTSEAPPAATPPAAPPAPATAATATPPAAPSADPATMSAPPAATEAPPATPPPAAAPAPAATPPAPPVVNAVAPTQNAEFTAMQAQMARMQAELAISRAEAIQAKAITFAQTTIRSGKSMPSEEAALIASYSQAAMHDYAGVATFSAGKTNVALLEDLIAARPAHTMTSEMVPTPATPGQAAAFNQATTPTAPGAPAPVTPTPEAEKKRLLSLTPLGRATMSNAAAANGNGAGH